MGFGVARINKNGRAIVSGKLGDGTSYSSATFVRPDGGVPVYTPLYGKRGSVFGTAKIDQITQQLVTVTTVAGQIGWFKPKSSDLYFPGGISLTVLPTGAPYKIPAINFPPVPTKAGNPDGNNAQVSIVGDGLRRALSQRVFLDVRPVAGPYAIVVKGQNALHLSGTINVAAGTIKGTFYDPFRRTDRDFSGVFLQDSINKAAGVFRGTKDSGRFVLTPD